MKLYRGLWQSKSWSFLFLFLSLFMSVSPDTSFAFQDTPFDLEQIVQEAVENNQELQAQKEKVQATRALAPLAGALQDPRLGLAIANLPTDTFEFDQEAMTQKQISIAQKIPWFGTLDLAEESAQLKAVELGYLVVAQELKLVRKVKDAWFDLGFTERELEINKQLSEIITSILKIAETRYATGAGLQQDILLAQVQLSELIDKEISINDRKRQSQDTLGQLLNRSTLYYDSSSKIGTAQPLDLNSDQLTANALKYNPQIGAAKTAIFRAEIEKRLAEKDYMPDMDVKVTYGQRDDDPISGNNRADFLSAGVSFTLPIWQRSRQDSKLSASKISLSSVKRRLQNIQKSLPHQVDSLVSAIESGQENYQLYTGAIAIQATQLSESSLSAYSVGKVEFATMLSAKIRQLQIQLKAERYKYKVHKSLARLEEIVGFSTMNKEEYK